MNDRNMEANKKKILVVDDEQDLCEILKFNLETEGYQADTANSGEEAMSMDIASYLLPYSYHLNSACKITLFLL